jgi:DNA-binding cell septation regulator SpoVG
LVNFIDLALTLSFFSKNNIKIQNIRIIEKTKKIFIKGPNMKTKKLRDQTVFGVLGHQVCLETKQLKITNSFYL